MLTDRRQSVLKSWWILAATILWLPLWPAPAPAEVVSIGARSLTLDPIAGYCALDKTNDNERRVYGAAESAVSAQYRLLAYWVDCDVLKDFRAGGSKALIPYVLVMAAKKYDWVYTTTLSRQDVVDRTFAELAKGPKVPGVMERDADGVYFGQMRQITSDQKTVAMAGVTGMTKVKRFVLSAVAYDIYANDQTFRTLKDRAATTVQSLIAANRADE
jgi:hypothetical protein